MKLYHASCRRYGQSYYFSWKLQGDCGQKSYQILISDEEGNTVWDSGQTETANRHNIPCEASLDKGRWYQYQLIVTGTNGATCTYTGHPFATPVKAWHAHWIEPDRERNPYEDCKNPHEKIKEIDPLERLDPAVYMRKVVTLEQKPARGTIYITAHGIYSLWINGTLVSDLFAPGYTSYQKRLEYQCIDVSRYLVEGKNVIAAIVADGWYTGKIGAVGCGQQYGKENGLLFQLELTYPDGGFEEIVSDEHVTWTVGAYRYADLFIGEYYDTGMEPEGWLTAGYQEDDVWHKVRVVPAEYEALCLQSIDPVEETRTILPKLIVTPKGDQILDAGETIVGYVSFHLHLKKHQTIKLEHTETLDKEGEFLRNIIGHNKDQTNIYKSNSDSCQEYKPMFTFHGFRYVRISGVDVVDPKDFLVHVIETPKALTGSFTCSDPRLNQLAENILRSQKGNMICIPTDCPQREKTGWTGDAQIYAPTACYEEDVEAFFRHWLVDMKHEQLKDGQIPHIIPYIPSHDYMKPPGIEGVSAAGWSDAAVILPWRLYEAYGDKEILRENFDMMHRYMESVCELASELPAGMEHAACNVIERQRYLWNTGFQYGDWLMPSIVMAGKPILEVVKETGHIVASFLFAITSRLMAKICEILEKKELAQKYQSLHEKIKAAILEEYFREDGTILKDFQGVYVLALAADVVPEDRKPGTINRLKELIAANHGLLDTGFLSVPYLLPVLAENGQHTLANQLLFADACPSWLYEVKMGATTMWEYWNGYQPDGTPDECSMNHFAFGCVGEYLFRNILGLAYTEPGFGKIRFQPDISCGLDYAQGHFDSIWGKTEICWKRNSDVVELSVTIPPDVEAEIIIGGRHWHYGCGTWNISTEYKEAL